MGVGLVVRAGSLFLIYTNMTLHEAIILVISSAQKQLTCSEVANEINRKHLYIKGGALLLKHRKLWLE